MLQLLCPLMGHRRSKRVWHDGLDYRATCVRCGQSMVRDEVGAGWRLFDRERDFSLQRSGKPERH